MTDENRPGTVVANEIRRRRRRPVGTGTGSAARARARSANGRPQREKARGGVRRPDDLGCVVPGGKEDPIGFIDDHDIEVERFVLAEHPCRDIGKETLGDHVVSEDHHRRPRAPALRAPSGREPRSRADRSKRERAEGPGSRGRLRCGFRSASARSESRSSPGGGAGPFEGAVFQQSRELEPPVVEAEAIEVGDDIRVVRLVPELGERFRKLGRRTHREGPEDAGELEVQLAAEAGERGAQAGPQPLRLGAAQRSRPAVLEPGENEKKGEKRERQQEAEPPSRLRRHHDFILREPKRA